MLAKKLLGAAKSAVVDAYYNLVTLLLPGDGTNGAQNNTFLDSSTNNFTITRNGNTTQGTFSPFSQTGWGNFFDGAGDYLSIPANAAFNFGTGDFTIEFWLNYNSVSGFQTLLDINYTTASNVLLQPNSGTMVMYYNGGTTLVSSVTDTAGVWRHYAIVRSGTTITMYRNGVSVGSATYSGNVGNSSAIVYVGGSTSGGGYYINGYLSNFRMTNTAVYTAAFTPPTSQLTAISGTALLTCQSNRFIDNSTNAFAITINGTPSVQAFSPFAPTAAYSASTVGGSGYFDGTGDYLSVADNAALNFGTGDLTVEGWVYMTALPASQFQIAGKFNTGSPFNGWTLSVQNTGVPRIWFGTSYFITASSALSVGSWNHLAMVRSGSTVTLWVNGVSAGSATSSTNVDNTGTCFIGTEYNASNGLIGYLSSVRLVKGTAVYTAAFTPPTAPLTAITNTSLLTNFTNAGITDATSKNDLETVGNAQISTAQSKFGGSSMLFDGTGDWLTLANSQNFTPGVGDWTVEGWLYPISGNWALVSGSNFYINNNGGNVYVGDGSIDIITVSPPSTGVWTHIAATKSGSTVRLFYNGTQVGSSTTALSTAITTSMAVGGRPPLGISTNGYIDDFRITKGYARYTANFTAPTAPFPLS